MRTYQGTKTYNKEKKRNELCTVKEIIAKKLMPHPAFSSSEIKYFERTIKLSHEGDLYSSFAELVLLNDTFKLYEQHKQQNCLNFEWDRFSLNVDAYKNSVMSALKVFRNLNIPERPPQNSKFIKIMSPEIFTTICKDLPYSALFSLSKTCVIFHFYLVDSNSLATQKIWENSRYFDPVFKYFKPPPGWSEYNFMLFYVPAKPICQFCGTFNNVTIYWQFRVRCCTKCLSARTILIKEVDFEAFEKFLKDLPYIHLKKGIGHVPHYQYWETDILNRIKVISKHSEQDEQISQKAIELKKYQSVCGAIALKVHLQDYGNRRKIKKLKEISKPIVYKGKSEDIEYNLNDIMHNFISWRRAKFIINESDYKTPILKSTWINIEREIILEAERPRRQKIIQRFIVKKYPRVGPKAMTADFYLEEINNPLKYASIDPLIILLRCPSYRSPLLLNDNPNTVYDDQFLNMYLLPRLEEEARQLNPLPKGNVITVSTAILMGIEQPIFRCILPLCQRSRKLYKPKIMEIHLKSPKHDTLFERTLPERDQVMVYMDNSTIFN